MRWSIKVVKRQQSLVTQDIIHLTKNYLILNHFNSAAFMLKNESTNVSESFARLPTHGLGAKEIKH